MGIEIERKFLVKSKNAPMLFERRYDITQGYILNSKEKVVRIRLVNGRDAIITIKGQNIGMSRPEFEYSIPFHEGDEMMKTMCSDVISKTRYICMEQQSRWEVDFFHGDNEGLIVAEIELNSEDEKINYPDWIGKEVTDKKKYYNNNLITNPYKNWKK
jgi:adenylate cyclase